MQKSNSSLYSAIFILFAGISVIGLLIERNQTVLFALAYFSAFFAYFWICRANISFRTSMSLGIGLRLFLFIGLPVLSDDIYRFLWDGYLVNGGVNPYQVLPSSVELGSVKGIDSELYENLNSKNYFSIYPPLNQVFFWLSTMLGGTNWLISADVIRIFLLGADIGSFRLLRKLLHHPSQAHWFWLNPLVILELVGNVHFEGLIIFFILLGICYLKERKTLLSGGAFGLSIATKFLPLILLPAILFKKWKAGGLKVTLAAFTVSIFTLLPIVFSAELTNMISSFDLYFRKFEFNASLYYLVREAGYWMYGYNTIAKIGPILGVITFLGIMWVSIIGAQKNWAIAKTALFAWSIYLLLATTVHPWYIVPLIALGILSGYYYPIVWSLFIVISYFGYTEIDYKLSPLWLVLEYIVVLGFFIFEQVKQSHEKSAEDIVYE